MAIGNGTIVLILLGTLWLGGLIYCLLGLAAARRLREEARSALTPPFVASLLKPLLGSERNLEQNLESFFQQDYPDYEILFGVSREDDPALEIVERLRRKYPERDVQVVIAAASPYPNAKVYSMQRMARVARGQVLVISDSDVSVTPDYLRAVISGFADRQTGVVTCLYRGVPGASLWSRLEALGMSTRFMPGILAAWALEDRKSTGIQFALGPTMAIRRECLRAIGGFSAMANYLADDFVLGKWAAKHGFRVVLSPYVLNHHVLGESFAATFRHQLRWARSTRSSRPLGYIGELFTHPTALAAMVAVWGLTRAGMPISLAAAILAVTLALRWSVSYEVGCGVLHDSEIRRSWWLIPLGDLLGFAIWLCGFTGRKIYWRGIAYRVGSDGRFEPLEADAAAGHGHNTSIRTIAEEELAAAGSDHIHRAGRQ